jgi:hypothetical protein
MQRKHFADRLILERYRHVERMGEYRWTKQKVNWTLNGRCNRR